MSTQLYYTVSNSNQSLPDSAMAFAPDRSAFLPGARNRTPAQHPAGFSHGGMNMYQQQQIQAALYQQQQLEFAQQQAQLEMHLQLEQMRLQNLALQEQIMMGQVHAHQQSQAEAQAQQLRGGFHHPSQKALGAGRLNLNHSQTSTFAERALARRQQAEADALYAQYYPNEQEEDDVLQEMPVQPHRLEHADSQTPPALVFSKPDEAFPVLAPSSAAVAPAVVMRAPNLSSKGHQHTDSGSSVSTFGSLSSFTTRSPDHSESELADSGATSGDASRSKTIKSASGASPPKKKFSDVVKSSPASVVKPLAEVKPAAPSISVNTTVAPKLNPFSSVFVPGTSSSSASSSATEKISITSSGSPATAAEPSLSASSNNSVSSTTTVESCAAPTAAPAVGLYRAVRSKSPPGPGSRASGARSVSSTLPAVVMGAMPTRQPRGPAAEAELTNQNFATRIRKRAIGAIKTLGPRVPGASPSPTPTSFQFHPQLQQQMLEGLLHQQQANQAGGFHSFLDVEQVGYPHGMVSPGLAHLMAAARAREERFGF